MTASEQVTVEATKVHCATICQWMRREGYGLRWQRVPDGWFIQMQNKSGHVVGGPVRANKARALMALCDAISGVRTKRKP